MWEIDGTAVRRLRREAGLTQDQLAAKSGVPQGTISNIENGKVERTSQANVRSLATAIGVGVEAIRGEQRDEPDEPVQSASVPVELLIAQLEGKVKQLAQQTVRIPVLNVAAHAHFDGFPLDLERVDVERWIWGGPEYEGRDIWAIRVRGTCLLPDVKDGETAIFERGATVGADDYVVAVHEGVWVVKRANVIDGRVTALYDNEDGWFIVNGHTTVIGKVEEFRWKP